MSSTDKERLADSILVEMLQEQITELSSAEKTIKIAISDLEGGQTIAALQRLLGEVKGKIERLRNFTTSLSSSKNKSATWAELRRLRKSCRPPPAGLLHDWKRGADSLRKAWEVVDDKTGAPPVRDECASFSSTPPERSTDNLDLFPESHPRVRLSLGAARASTSSAESPDAEDVMVTPQSSTINLDSGPVCVHAVTDGRLEQTVAQKILVVKLDWGKELGRIQDMQRETRRLFRHVEREKTFGRAKEAHERAKKELEDLQRRQQEERQQDQSHVKTFHLEISQSKAEHLRELVKKVQEEDGLREVIHNLLKDFNVRLLGIDSGLRFLMDVPVEEYEDVLRQQDDMKKLLEQACPGQPTEWTALRPLDAGGDLNLGQPIPAETSANVQVPQIPGPRERTRLPSPGVCAEPLTSTPRLISVSDMIVEDDHLNPFIRAIIVTQSDQLVMADWNNSMLKICDLNNRETVTGVKIKHAPCGLAQLPDGTVAVTSGCKRLYFVCLCGVPSVMSRVQTARDYLGVCAGTVENTLIVSCTSDDDGPASVDVITRHGGFLQTLLNTSMVHELDSPEYLWKHGGELLVSDPCANAVHRLQVDKKCPVTKLAHSFLQFPHQTVADSSGNVYIACCHSHCVLVMSADGEWRRLLEGSVIDKERAAMPVGVSVAGTKIIVSWTCSNLTRTVIAVYDTTQERGNKDQSTAS